MGQFIDLTGQRFHMWTVIGREPNRVDKNGHIKVMWLCRCDCGVTRSVDTGSLRSGKSKSCGCYRSDVTTRQNSKWRHTDRRLHSIWQNMKDRCYRPTCSEYQNYGGRGIAVCDLWKDNFDAFYEWAYSHGYKPNLTIDRIDVNGLYSPENCRWVDRKAQANNRTNNLLIEFNGQRKTAQQWAEQTGLQAQTIAQRIENGWSVDDALTKPAQKKTHTITVDGVTHTPDEWGQLIGLSAGAILRRLRLGWLPERAVTTPRCKA